MIFSEHQPRNDVLPLLLRVPGWVTHVMLDTILAAKEHIVCSACDVDGINETVFAECIGKVPKGAGVIVRG